MDEIDKTGEDPTQLSCEVADLLARAKKKSEEGTYNPEQKYRDYEEERDIDVSQEQELEVEKVVERNKEVERDLHKEKKRRKQQLLEKAKLNPKKALKQQQKKRKEALKAAKKQQSSDVEEKGEEGVGKKRRRVSFRQRVQKAVRKMANYSAHAKRAPGDQAGTFDDKVEAKKKKRGLKHDFTFGARTVIEYFAEKIGNVTIRGSVTRKEHSTHEGHAEVSQQQIRVEEAVTDRGRQLKGEEQLGNLSPDAVLNKVDRGGQEMSR